jgi:hypothetical protein
VNIQHSAADDGDGTWAITRKRHHVEYDDDDYEDEDDK